MLIKLLSASIRKQTQNKENHKMVTGSDGYHKEKKCVMKEETSQCPFR